MYCKARFALVQNNAMWLAVCDCDCSDGGSDVDMSSPLNYGTPSSRVGDTPRTPGAAGTPHRSRVDIRSERRPTVAVGASSEPVLPVLCIYTVSQKKTCFYNQTTVHLMFYKPTIYPCSGYKDLTSSLRLFYDPTI